MRFSFSRVKKPVATFEGVGFGEPTQSTEPGQRQIARIALRNRFFLKISNLR
jgi:hypothetical protein